MQEVMGSNPVSSTISIIIMLNWLKLISVAFLPGFFWATNDILNRVVSSKIHPLTGTVFISLGMLISSGLLWIFIQPTLPHQEGTPPNIILITIAAGLANTFGYFFFLKFLGAGGNFTQGLPIVLTITSLVAAIFGVLFYRDPITLRVFLGFLSAMLAIYLLS